MQIIDVHYVPFSENDLSLDLMELLKKRASEVGRTLKLENAIPKAIGKLQSITKLKKQSNLDLFL